MAIKVKEVGASTEKWSANAARAAEEFAVNAEAAAETWSGNTQRAADTFHQAITAPNMKERFRRGVARAGAAKFARKIREVGRDRFGPVWLRLPLITQPESSPSLPPSPLSPWIPGSLAVILLTTEG